MHSRKLPLVFFICRDIITLNTALTETEFVRTLATESCRQVKGRREDTEETAPELHARKTENPSCAKAT